MVRTDGRAVNGHVITKFSGMGRFTYPWCSASALHAPELRYQHILDHASKSPANCNQRGWPETAEKNFWYSRRKNVLRKLPRIPYRRLKAGFSVCWLCFKLFVAGVLSEVHEVRMLAPCKAFLFDMFALFSSLENYFGFRTTNVKGKTDHSVSPRWNKRFWTFLKRRVFFSDCASD